jgi:hypothetical protein
MSANLFDELDDSPRLKGLGYAVPNVHAGDPSSSSEAAASIEASGSRARHAAIVLRLVREMPGRTACELWEAASKEDKADLKELQRVRQRCTDLSAVGLIRRGESRVCAVRGTTQCVWEPAE